MKRKALTTMTLLAVLAGAAVLLSPQPAQAGGFSLSIGGIRIGSGYDYDDDYYYRRPRRHYRRSYRRHEPKVYDITPFRGHPPVFSVQPFRGHPPVIVSPKRDRYYRRDYDRRYYHSRRDRYCD